MPLGEGVAPLSDSAPFKFIIANHGMKLQKCKDVDPPQHSAEHVEQTLRICQGTRDVVARRLLQPGTEVLRAVDARPSEEGSKYLAPLGFEIRKLSRREGYSLNAAGSPYWMPA